MQDHETHSQNRILLATSVAAFSALIAGALASPSNAFADDTRNLTNPSASTSSNSNSNSNSNSGDQSADADTEAERVNVDTIKEKYWARGDQSELGVVQNRAYTKEHKWEVSLFGGTVATDPFLSVYNLGTTIGYHFSEYFAVQGVYFRDWASPSSALTTLQRQLTTQNNGSSQGASTNYNPPRDFYGAEAVGSLLYGKLSVFGQKIIYYDLNILGGLGFTATESGLDFTQDVGIGQQVYLSKHFSLKFDYRLMMYHETLTEHVITSEIGQPVGTRENFSNVFVFGVSFMFGPEARDSQKSSSGGTRR